MRYYYTEEEERRLYKKRKIVLVSVSLCIVIIVSSILLIQRPAKTNYESKDTENDYDEIEGELIKTYSLKTVDEFEEILSSDIRLVMGNIRNHEESDDKVLNAMNNQAWESMTKSGVNKSENSTQSGTEINASYPFIICGYGTGDGLERVTRSFSSIEENISSKTMKVIFNVDSRTCVHAHIAAPPLRKIKENDLDRLIIQPLLPAMKIRQSTQSRIQLGQIDFSSTLIVEFCVNHDENSTQDLFSIVNRLMESFQESIILSKDSNTAGSFANNESLRKRRTLENDFLHSCDSKMFLDGVEEVLSDSFTISLEHALHNYGIVQLRPCLEHLVSVLASEREVCSISLSERIDTLNVQAQWIAQSGINGQTPFFDVGLDGSGQVIGVSDTGLDVDNCYFYDSTGEVVKDGRTDFSRRKVVQYDSWKDGRDEKNGHGTHVVGTLLGRRAKDGKTESQGIADGVARNAKVAFFDLAKSIGGTLRMSVPTSAFEYVGKAGSKIHSVSWGTQIVHSYGVLDRTFDDFLHQRSDSLIVTAAGNNGENGVSTVASPSIAKNTLVVGASQSSGSDIYGNMLGHQYLSYFSAKGPTVDGRMGIDVVAPGSYILSAAANPNTVGECDDSEGARYDQGTSMAVPVVSGLAAIIRQYFEEGWFPRGEKNSGDSIYPSGALLKATIVNGAQSLLGAQAKDGTVSPVSDYDINVGFGRVNLLNSLPLAGQNKMRALISNDDSIGRGEEKVISFTIDKSDGCDISTVSATIAWMDPPSSSGCMKCMINDIDLMLTKGGSSQSIYPNGKGNADRVNNIERIRIDVNDGEEYKLSVYGKDLISSTQSYSLIVTGCISTDQNQSHAPVKSPTEHPTFQPIQKPSPKPDNNPISSINPTAIFTPQPSSLKTEPNSNIYLSTSFDGKIKSYGNMFDLVAKDNDISIVMLDLHIEDVGYESVEIYEKDGSYVNASRHPAAWTKIDSSLTYSNGYGIASSTEFRTPIYVKANHSKALYVTLTASKLVYSSGHVSGSIVAEDPYMSIFGGIGKVYPFKNSFADRKWNGGLYYFVSDPIFGENFEDEDDSMSLDDAVNIPTMGPTIIDDSEVEEEVGTDTGKKRAHHNHS